MYETGIILFAMFLGILIASLPMYLSLKSLGVGKSITRVILANILAGLATSMLGIALGGSTLGNWYFFLLAIFFIYKGVFGISWTKSFVVWLLSAVIAIVFVLTFVFLGVQVLASLTLPPIS